MFREWCLILFIFLLSCNSHTHEKQKAGTDSLHIRKAAKGILSNADTVIITEKAAVFYDPDSQQVNQAKKKDKADFYTIADDNLYYMALAHDFMDTMRIKIINVRNQKVFRYVSNDGSETIIRKDKLSSSGSLWGVYFFDPAKKPLKVDITDIEDEYIKYFK